VPPRLSTHVFLRHVLWSLVTMHRFRRLHELCNICDDAFVQHPCRARHDYSLFAYAHW
jgi:hypothetical protein